MSPPKDIAGMLAEFDKRVMFNCSTDFGDEWQALRLALAEEIDDIEDGVTPFTHLRELARILRGKP